MHHYYSIVFLFIWGSLFYSCSASPEELQILYNRKLDFIIQDYSNNFEQIPLWLSTFNVKNGTWTDVDYTSGCLARRANWPAQQHFIRIVTMASQLHTDLENINNSPLFPVISQAIDFWFDNNYIPDTCLDEGGLLNSTCPCGTPGFWNTNWFGQMILMPKLISNTCLLLKFNLTSTQLKNCQLIMLRVYNRIDTYVLGIGPMTGANMLDSATTLLNLGLLTNNETIVRDALNHFYSQTTITLATGEDGVKVDGSYLQHHSQLYTGNYGKDFINSVVVVYIQTSNTSFAPPLDSQTSFLTLINGTEWMIVANNRNNNNNIMSNLFWEYSVIGRMVSFPVNDRQASGGVALNLTRIEQATTGWSNASVIHDVVQRLSHAATIMKNQSSVGQQQGKLNGTRSFYTSDYLVHRSPDYVTTLKSFSKRTSNSECNNNQNPFGFHLSDGSLFTYLDGDEYEDVFAAWDWNLIPGTTVDYDATPFGCNMTQYYGNTTFVGSVTPNHPSLGYSIQGGMAVMQYMNPMTGHLKWEKTFYFFPGLYAVQVGPIHSKNISSPIMTTLDQSNLKGDVYINGERLLSEEVLIHSGRSSEIRPSSIIDNNTNTKYANIWHNRILYTILEHPNSTQNDKNNAFLLKVHTSSHDVNDWSKIGISEGKATQRLFTATLEHLLSNSSSSSSSSNSNDHHAVTSYIAQLNTDRKLETNHESLIQFATQDDDSKGRVRGAYYVKDKTMAFAFWTAASFVSPWGLTVISDEAILTFFTISKGRNNDNRDSYILTVSDPTQLLKKVTITVIKQKGFHNDNFHPFSRKIVIDLPQEERAGNSVSVIIS